MEISRIPSFPYTSPYGYTVTAPSTTLCGTCDRSSMCLKRERLEQNRKDARSRDNRANTFRDDDDDDGNEDGKRKPSSSRTREHSTEEPGEPLSESLHYSIVERSREDTRFFAIPFCSKTRVNELLPFYRRHLILSCQGRLNIFPFDDPLCSFAIESSEYYSIASTSYLSRPAARDDRARSTRAARKKGRYIYIYTIYMRSRRRRELERAAPGVSLTARESVFLLLSLQYRTSKRRSRTCGRTTRVRCGRARA